MDCTIFRKRLLAALQAAMASQSAPQVHLVYAPELADPLKLVNDTTRPTALLRLPFIKPEEPKDSSARLVTLDCRSIEPGLLTTDPGNDDPLLESSIMQAHAEVCLKQGVRTVLSNDDPCMAVNAVCGWIVSRDTAIQLAARINSLSNLPRPGSRQRRIRWHDPACLSTLWPSLAAAQKRALLGDATWLVHDVAGRMQRYAADRPGNIEVAPDPSYVHYLSMKQWQALDNIHVVNALIQSWHALCADHGQVLPSDATQQLHNHVQEAQKYKLDAENLMMYTMTAVQLPTGATEAPEFMHLLARVSTQGLPLRDGLHELPDSFWRRYQPAGGSL